MTSEPERRSAHRGAAVFVDIENMFGGYNGAVRSVPLELMFDEIRQLLRVRGYDGYARAKVYADWRAKDMSFYQTPCLRLGIELVHLPDLRSSPNTRNTKCPACHEAYELRLPQKNGADIELVLDALTTAYESPWIDVFVIVASDGDYVPLTRNLHRLGKTVIAVSVPNRTPNPNLIVTVDLYHEVGAPIASPTDSKRPPDAGPRPDANAQPDPKAEPDVKPEPDTKPGPRPAPPSQSWRPRTPVAAPVGPGAAEPRMPTRPELVEFVRDVLRTDPETVRPGDSPDASRVWTHLKAVWPRISIRYHGFESIYEVIDAAGGVPAATDSRSGAIAPTVFVDPPVSHLGPELDDRPLPRFRTLVQHMLTADTWPTLLAGLGDADGRIGLTRFDGWLAAMPDYVPFHRTGLPTIAEAYRYALTGTSYQLIDRSGDDLRPGEAIQGEDWNAIVARAASDPRAQPDFDDARLVQPDEAATAVAAGEPAYLLPVPATLGRVARFLAGQRPGGTALVQMLDDTREALRFVPDPELRKAILLLVRTGVLLGDGDEPEADRFVVVDPALANAGAMLDHVRAALAERLNALGWPTSPAALLDLVPTS